MGKLKRIMCLSLMFPRSTTLVVLCETCTVPLVIKLVWFQNKAIYQGLKADPCNRQPYDCTIHNLCADRFSDSTVGMKVEWGLR